MAEVEGYKKEEIKRNIGNAVIIGNTTLQNVIYAPVKDIQNMNISQRWFRKVGSECMEDLGFKPLKVKIDELKHENHGLQKTIDEMNHQIDELLNRNNCLEAKLKKSAATMNSMSDYESIIRKMSMENDDLRKTIGVLAEEITRLRKDHKW